MRQCNAGPPPLGGYGSPPGSCTTIGTYMALRTNGRPTLFAEQRQNIRGVSRTIPFVARFLERKQNTFLSFSPCHFSIWCCRLVNRFSLFSSIIDRFRQGNWNFSCVFLEPSKRRFVVCDDPNELTTGLQLKKFLRNPLAPASGTSCSSLHVGQLTYVFKCFCACK